MPNQVMACNKRNCVQDPTKLNGGYQANKISELHTEQVSYKTELHQRTSSGILTSKKHNLLGVGNFPLNCSAHSNSGLQFYSIANFNFYIQGRTNHRLFPANLPTNL